MNLCGKCGAPCGASGLCESCELWSTKSVPAQLQEVDVWTVVDLDAHESAVALVSIRGTEAEAIARVQELAAEENRAVGTFLVERWVVTK